MPKDYSPFTPGQPVPMDFFVGRFEEVQRLIEKVKASRAGKLQVLFLSGERGIGKSSLASFVRYIAQRDHKILDLHTFLGGVASLKEMVRRVFNRLLNESLGKSWEEKIKHFFGNRIKQVGLFGVSVEFEAPDKDLQQMVHDFAPALRRLSQELREEKDAILLVLDDINGLADSVDFANWMKSLVDEIATSRVPLPLCLVLVGLEERRQSLVALQPSLARVFDLIEIKTLTEEETKGFFRSTFSKVGVSVDEKAVDLMSRFAGGLPVFAHEIGDATFRVDTDNCIDEQDALKGILIAADIIGRKHLEPQVFRAIQSVRYHEILRKITQKPFDISFKNQDLQPLLSGTQLKVLSNFLARMKKLGVIQTDPDSGPGTYRFVNRLHHLYFWLAAQAKETPEA